MSDSITVSGTVSFGMQYRVSRAAALRGSMGWFPWLVFVGGPILAALPLLSAGSDLTEPTSSGPPMWVILAAGPAFMLILMPLLYAWSIAQARRRNPALCRSMTYTVTREGFAVKGENFETKLQWPVILRAVETKEFFLFFISALNAHFIPKAFVSSPDELQAIRAIVRGALGPKARLKA
jgi:hypothetical protein